MFKICTKQIVALVCGLIGLLAFAFTFAPITLAADHYINKPEPGIDVPTPTPTPMLTPTPTPTPTPAPTPVLTLSQPGSDNQPIGHPGTKVDITGQGFPPGSSVRLYTTITSNQCQSEGSLKPFTSQPTENVQADGSFDLQTTWPNNASQSGTAYYVCAISSAGAIPSGQTFSVAPQVTVSTSANSINPGDSITITGDNWLPPLQLQVSIVPNTGSTNAIANTNATPDSTGHFSVSLTTDKNTQPGQYVVNVSAPDESTLTNQPSNTIITINGQATPTVTPTASSAKGGSSGNGGVTILASILGGLGLLCVIVGGVMFAVSGPSSGQPPGSSPSRMP